MRLNLRDAFLGMENETDLPPADIADDVGENSVEAATAEVEESATDLAETHEQVDLMEEVAESLECIAHHINESVKLGGMEPREAAAIHLAQSIALRPLGLEAMAVTLESFDGTDGRLTASVSMESAIGDFFKRIWEAIKRTIASIRDKVKELFQKIFTATGKVKRRAQALSATVEALTEPSEKEVEISGGLVAHLGTGGTLKDFASVATGLKTVTDLFTGEVPTAIEKFASTLLITANSAHIEDAEGAPEDIAGIAAKLHAPTISGMAKSTDSKKWPDSLVYHTNELIGHRALFLVYGTAETPPTLKSYAGLKLLVDQFDPGQDVKKFEAVKLSTPDKAAIKALLEAVNAATTKVDLFKKQNEKAGHVTTKLVELGDRLSEKLQKLSDDKQTSKAIGQELLDTVRTTSTLLNTSMGEMAKYLVFTCESALHAVERAVACYKK